MTQTAVPASHEIAAPGTRPMERAIRVIAGSFVLVSLVLAQLVNPWWLLLAGFVGANLVQSAFTGFCPAELLLRRLGICRDAVERR
jgi:DUF2892 family protein